MAALRRLATLAIVLVLVLALAPSAGAAPADDLRLATAFRPHLRFDAGTLWRPVDVDRLLAEPGHAVCRRPGPCTPLVDPAQLGGDAAYLDLRGGGDAGAPDRATCPRSAPRLRDCDVEPGRSVIYAKVTRRGPRIAIDFWWFLRFNSLLFARHEGDWEGVTVVVDRAGRRVLEVHYAAHKGSWRYAPGVPRLVGRHVQAYVARGSHATYPRPCRLDVCSQTGTGLYEGRFGGDRPWTGNAPERCGCVRLLPLGPWNGWNGRWGAQQGAIASSPRTPAFQDGYRHPFHAEDSPRFRRRGR